MIVIVDAHSEDEGKIIEAFDTVDGLKAFAAVLITSQEKKVFLPSSSFYTIEKKLEELGYEVILNYGC
jgi:hypothetical protein